MLGSCALLTLLPLLATALPPQGVPPQGVPPQGAPPQGGPSQGGPPQNGNWGNQGWSAGGLWQPQYGWPQGRAPGGYPGYYGGSWQGQCTKENAIVRKAWNKMSRDEHLNFVNAVKCLHSKPSLYTPLAPAAQTRFDDFSVVHINGSYVIHLDGQFLSWHRHFVHVFEHTLRTECGYPADQGTPYWDWTATPDLDKVQMFDGSDESLSGNGEWDPSAPAIELGTSGTLPRGTGGGCVTTGPFANWKIRFGPFPGSVLAQGYLPSNWTEPNERCFTRDLNPIIATNNMNQSFVDQVQAAPNISDVQDLLTPPGFKLGFLGLHRAGHCAIGQPMADFFASSQDPIFFLHHAEIDRMFAMWQDQDPETRRYQYNGTSTVFNPVGVTPEVDRNTVLNFGILAPSMKLGDLANPMSGPYCYRYE